MHFFLFFIIKLFKPQFTAAQGARPRRPDFCDWSTSEPRQQGQLQI
jgi:hypothetical protein